MERKEFIKNCGYACFASTTVSVLLQSCVGSKIINGKIVDSDILIPLSDFQSKRETNSFKKYIIVQNDLLQYPICVYRFSETEYTALWMSCTHQGTELQVFGDKLQCPAHGSEFTNRGAIQNGPADKSLRTFPVKIGNNQLFISLKAV
jgi:Rieske Fe-S protein